MMVYRRTSMVAQKVKSLLAVRETWVRSLGQEDPLGEEMATHSSILVWRIPWTEEPGGLQSMGSQRVGDDWATDTRIGLWRFSVLSSGSCCPFIPHFKTSICWPQLPTPSLLATTSLFLKRLFKETEVRDEARQTGIFASSFTVMQGQHSSPLHREITDCVPFRECNSGSKWCVWARTHRGEVSLCLAWCLRPRVCEADDSAQSMESSADWLGQRHTQPLEVPSGCECPHGHPTFEAQPCGCHQTPQSTWIPSRESSAANQLPDLRKLIQHFRRVGRRHFRPHLLATGAFLGKATQTPHVPYWELDGVIPHLWTMGHWRRWEKGKRTLSTPRMMSIPCRLWLCQFSSAASHV